MATSTPWGPSQDSEKIASGIMWYSTAGHGGVHLSPSRNALVPAYMRSEGGWYEEDCEWCIPALVFADEWQAYENKLTWKNDRTAWRKHAEDTMRNWLPYAYEAFFNVKLQPGQSRVKDEKDWWEAHKHEMIVVSAVCDSNYVTEDGKECVMVTACIGGRHHKTGQYCGELRQFIVPRDEYDNRGNFGFVVNTTRYIEKVA